MVEPSAPTDTAEPSQAPPRPQENMRSKTVRGTFYSIVGQGLKNILRLGSNVILARLLTRDDFGVSLLVNTVMIGLEMISDLGIETSIIQSKRGEEPTFLDTAYSIQFVRGVLLFLLACLAAWPAAWYFKAPELTSLIPLAATGTLFRGLWPTKLHLLRRHLEVKKLMIITVGAQALSVVVMAVHAYIYRSVWALVLGSVTVLATPLLISAFIPGHRNRFKWEPTAAKELLSFGQWIFVSTLITFLADRFAVLASGRLVDTGTLGVFGMATMLSTLPTAVGGPAVNAVILPALSEAARTDRSKLADGFHRARAVVLPLLLFVTLGLVLWAPAFFGLVYKPEFRDAGWMTQLAIIGTWFGYQHDAWSRGLLAVGISRPLAVANAIKLVFTVVLALGGFYLFEFPGLILGSCLGAASGYLAISYALAKAGMSPFKLDAKFGLLALVLGGVGSQVPIHLAPLLGLDDYLWLSIVTGLVFLIPAGLFSAKRLKAQLKKK